jgi:glycerophosphoryl diester phosphodiesterase
MTGAGRDEEPDPRSGGPAPPAAPGGLPRTLVLAHRGGESDFPDNSLAAFRRLVALSVNGVPVDGVEIDVQATADGVLVVTHDVHLGGWPVDAMTLADLRELQGADLDPDLAIPTFEDVLRVLPNHLVVNVEVKVRQVERALIRAIDAAHRRQTVVISSFDAAPLLVLRRLAPEIRCGLVAGVRVADLLKQAKHALADVVCVEEQLADESLVRHMHQHGVAVYVWTVNEPHDLERCFRLGVDAVITDHPERALDLRGRLRPAP